PPVEERVQDGVAEAALLVVVLDGDQASGVLGGAAQGAPVDGLDRVQIDDAGLDAVPVQRVGGGQRLGHGDARRDEGQPVVRGGAQHLAAADGELLVGAVD